jgi:hypothetical protein
MTSQSASRTVIRSASNAALAAARTGQLAVMDRTDGAGRWPLLLLCIGRSAAMAATSARAGDLSVRVLLDARRRRCACHVQLQQLRTVGLAHVQQPVVGVVQPA